MRAFVIALGVLAALCVPAVFMAYGHSARYLRITVCNASGHIVRMQAQIDSDMDMDIQDKAMLDGETTVLTASKVDAVILLEVLRGGEEDAGLTHKVAIALQNNESRTLHITVMPESVKVTGARDFSVTR